MDANKHMKRWLTSLVIRETQSKSIRYHYIHFRIDKVKKQEQYEILIQRN